MKLFVAIVLLLAAAPLVAQSYYSPYVVRANVLQISVSSTSATPVTLAAAQGAGRSVDLMWMLVTSETATACVLSFTDGTKTYKGNTGANAGSGFVFAPAIPLPASAANVAWTLTGCAAVNLDIIGEGLIVQ